MIKEILIILIIFIVFMIIYSLILSRKAFGSISDNWDKYRRSPLFMPFTRYFNKATSKVVSKSKIYSAKGVSELKKASDDLKSVGGSFTTWNTFQIIQDSIENMQNFYDKIINAVYNSMIIPLLRANDEISSILSNYFGDIKTLKVLFNLIMAAYKRIVGNVFENIEKLNGSMQFYQMKMMDMFKRSMSINVLNMFYGESVALTMQSVITGPLLEMSIFYPIFGVLTIFFIILCIACIVILIIHYFCQAPTWGACSIVTIPSILWTCIPCAICFGKDTPVQLKDSVKSIQYIYEHQLCGTELVGGGIIESILKFDIRNTSRQLYRYNDILVSGEHMVYENNVPIRVKNSCSSRLVNTDEEYIYCLITSNRKIVINNCVFADFMESDDIPTTLHTYRLVEKALNETKQCIQTNKDIDHLYQWGLSKHTCIKMKNNSLKYIEDIGIGDTTTSGKVTGIVVHLAKPITMFSYKDHVLSGSQMIYEDGIWLRVHQSKYSTPCEYQENVVYSITTETNRLELQDGTIVTDYFELDENDKTVDQVHNINLQSMIPSLQPMTP